MEQQAGQARFLYQRVPCSPQVAYRFATPLRDIEGQWDISRSALDRHKGHVAAAIVTAQERREEKAGENLLDEMKRVQRKAWELLAKMESEGDHRGLVVALREVRECMESLGAMLAHAGGSSEMLVRIVHIGANGGSEQGMTVDCTSSAGLLPQSNQELTKAVNQL